MDVPSPPRGYAGKGVRPDVKEYAAAIALALQERGWTVSEIVELLQQTDYCPAQRTLERHIAALKKGDTPLSREKNSGRPSKLSEEQWMVVAGWILRHPEPLSLSQIRTWISLNLDVTIDTSTISRFLQRFGLSRQLVGSRPLTAETRAYIAAYDEWSQGNVEVDIGVVSNEPEEMKF